MVIDEMHEYRGFFGGNMALLLRRFFLHLERIGASPRVFLSTATCSQLRTTAATNSRGLRPQAVQGLKQTDCLIAGISYAPAPNISATGVKGASGSSGYMGRWQTRCPRVGKFALVSIVQLLSVA